MSTYSEGEIIMCSCYPQYRKCSNRREMRHREDPVCAGSVHLWMPEEQTLKEHLPLDMWFHKFIK